MPRTKSSNIARLNDLIDALAKTAHDLYTEVENLKNDSDRLKEIEPALRKLQSALTPAIAQAIPPTEPPPAGLGEPPIEPVKRSRRIKKVLTEADNAGTPQSDS